MPDKKTILYAICTIVLLLLIIFWFIPTFWGMKDVNPYLSEIGEMIRCRFEMGVCLSIPRNPARDNENIVATVRTQIYYVNSKVCLANYNTVVKSCTITEVSKEQYKCSMTFPAKPGRYYAFIDNEGTCEDPIATASEHKTKDIELRTI